MSRPKCDAFDARDEHDETIRWHDSPADLMQTLRMLGNGEDDRVARAIYWTGSAIIHALYQFHNGETDRTTVE
jgi:hypothetical protein